MNHALSTENKTHLNTISNILLRCFIIFTIILLAWFVWFLTAGDFGFQYHSSWFGITEREFNLANLYGMLLFKLLGVTLFLIPSLGIKMLLNCKCAERKRRKSENTKSLPKTEGGLCCSGS